MAPTFAFLLLIGLFETTTGYYCRSYITKDNNFKPSVNCYSDYCCGTCDNRYCCSVPFLKITDAEQNACEVKEMAEIGGSIIASVVVSLIVLISFIVCCCCCCPCCCLYQMCRKPRPVAGTHVTTVVNTQCIQQPAAVQYPVYQPVPTQPAYGAQPVQAGAYPAQPYAPGPQQPYAPGPPQPCAPGPPPPYHTAMSPGYPTDQAQYGGGPANLPLETSKQLAYNPAYIEPPKASY